MKNIITILVIVLVFVLGYLLGNLYPVLNNVSDTKCVQGVTDIVTGVVVGTEVYEDLIAEDVEFSETRSLIDNDANNVKISEVAIEAFTNAPAEIKEVFTKNNETYFLIDILSINPNFLPGLNPFFLNKNTKLREVSVNNATKSYDCGTEGSANISVNIQSTIDQIKEILAAEEGGISYYFDIEGSIVKSIYQQCLP